MKKLLTCVLAFIMLSYVFVFSACADKNNAESKDNVLYSFGVLSDIHLQSTDYAVDENYSLTDYQRALTYYKNNDVDFIAVAGDIVANNRKSMGEANAPEEWVAELNLFKEYNELYFENKPVYTCTGNHDATPYGRYEGDYISSIRNELDGVGLSQIVPNYGDGTKTAEQIWQEIVGNPINFTIQHNGDIFMFFSMYYWYYAKFCRASDIAWLENQLETFKDKRVFLFSHLPIIETFDPSRQGAGVAKNGFQTNYQFGQLVEKYENVMFFSGHTHFDLSLEATDQKFTNTNLNGEGMKQIHCASNAYTRLPIYDENGEYKLYSDEERCSQGYIVYVYANKIVIKGIDFTQGHNGGFIANANYEIYY